MDDYYELLGVESDAGTDDIRSAYRDRKAALDGKADGGKDAAAKLNKAWNVLSDPYQRGRYDAQLENHEPGDEDDDIEVSSNGKTSASRAKPAARQPRAKREMPPPTIQPPAGTRYPTGNRARLTALGIDMAVLLVLFIGLSFAGRAVADSQHPGTSNTINQLTKDLTADGKAVDKANKDASAAKATNTPAQQEAKQKQKDDQKKLDDANAILAPTQNLFVGITFVLGFLYLVIPASLSSRTIGMRGQHLKVVRDDGSRLRTGDAIKRYGVLIIVTYALWFLVGPLAPVLVLVGVTTFMRNPNQQGMHDRLAHTLVVVDDTTA